jgi:TonB family protein
VAIVGFKVNMQAARQHSRCFRLRGTFAFAISAAAVTAALVLCADPQAATEYQVKAAYLYNFAKMAQWPPGKLAGLESALIIGVYGGDDEFPNVLRATLAGKAVNGHAVEIRRLRSLEELRFCHLVFVRSSDRNTRTAIAALEKSGILLVGEDKEFLRQGGMITLIMSDGKISYEVNDDALQRAGIRYGTGVASLAQNGVSSDMRSAGSRVLKVEKAPQYPAILQQIHLKGAVQLEAVVRADGTVKEVHILGGHPMLADAAVQAVKQWRYEANGKETVEPVRINFGQ